MPVAAQSAVASAVDRRASRRISLGRQGLLRVDDRRMTVLIQDLTRDGCSIEIDGDLGPASAVNIGIPGIGPTQGRIVWQTQRAFGCVFDESLPPGAVTAAYSGPTASARSKFSAPARLGVTIGAVAVSWVAIAGCLLKLIYSGSLI